MRCVRADVTNVSRGERILPSGVCVCFALGSCIKAARRNRSEQDACRLRAHRCQQKHGGDKRKTKRDPAVVSVWRVLFLVRTSYEQQPVLHLHARLILPAAIEGRAPHYRAVLTRGENASPRNGMRRRTGGISTRVAAASHRCVLRFCVFDARQNRSSVTRRPYSLRRAIRI